MDESPIKIYGRVSKKCTAKISPPKLTFSGNFTKSEKQFDVSSPLRSSTRQSILDMVMKKTESHLGQEEKKDENPMYEDPRDIIGDKPTKPPRKRNIQAIAVTSPRAKEGKSHLKEQKKRLSKKYENLITSLMDKCEEHLAMLAEKDSHIAKLKEKLKTVLDYNRQFADENDELRNNYETLVKYVEECKKVIKEERNRNLELESRFKNFEVPDKDGPEPSGVPLVEVCLNCGRRAVLLQRARDRAAALQADMQALKDVLYRLNIQLSRYQEKLRTNMQALGTGDAVCKPSVKSDGLDSLINASLGCISPEVGNTVEPKSSKGKTESQPQETRFVDLSGLLSAQALAPLFDAYQENLQEKDSLILDYEKQFENINKKSKEIVSENKSLSEKVASLETELAQVRQGYKKLVVEKETADIEKATLLQRAERAEMKLKEVYEMYEDKISAMMRDYETVHREYFTVKNALEATEGKVAQLDVLRSRTVPADLHERRLDHCKRLLEELKHQYAMESDRKTDQINKQQEQLRLMEEKLNKLCQDHESCKEELKTALKNVRLYRKAAAVFRQRWSAAARSSRRARARADPLRRALLALDNIKQEIKAVKSRASSSLAELERRVVEQGALRAATRRDLELQLQHKEDIIRNLIDKVADVEEVRLSQTNTRRLQGIISDSSEPTSEHEQDAREHVRVHIAGRSQEDGKRKHKSKEDG